MRHLSLALGGCLRFTAEHLFCKRHIGGTQHSGTFRSESIGLNMPVLILRIQPFGWGVSLRNINFWNARLYDTERTIELQLVQGKLPKGTSMVLPGYLGMVSIRRAELGGLWVSGSGRVPCNLDGRHIWC